MTRWHRIFYYLQFVVLAVFIAVIFLKGIQGTLTTALLMLLLYTTEIGILEQNRRMNQNLIYYRKSGFFAMLDLFAVTAFFVYTVIFAVDFMFLQGISYYTEPFISLLAFTLVRKLYIYKHYTYEK